MKTFRVFYAPNEPENLMVFEVEAENEEQAQQIADEDFQLTYSRDLWKDFHINSVVEGTPSQ